MAKTVMIVDDSASLRQVVRMALSGAGYQVMDAGDGQEALDKLNGNKVHLVISDVNMPRMDGITFVKTLKQKPEYRFLPVIMLTTEAGEARKDEGRAAGAKAWMIKPFQPAQMLAAVSKLVGP
ncbi:MAG: response regulator [Acidihalobacter sp.]|jgi:two-component system, chemotaxis family, chemotaxis protein CheY|uniref:response regulator n=1 Tax=Acidihalobacter sp. TaxID=1872108 RepID=UPI00307E2EF2